MRSIRRWPACREWVVVRDESGHHRALSSGIKPGEVMVDDEWYSYREASRLADELNEVAEVLGS